MTINPSIYFTVACCTFGCIAGFMKPERYQKELDAKPRNFFESNGNIINMFDNIIVRPRMRRSEEKIVNVPMEGNTTDCKANISCNYVTFHLYTKSNPTYPQELKINDLESLNKSYFNSKNPTRFITHGWIETGNARSCWSIRDAYLNLNDSKDNVIIIDWSKISQTPYQWSVDHVDVVSREVSNMIEFMVEKGVLNVNDTTLVGYSLGTHVIGIAGHFSKYKVRHVVGLDPALVMFNFASPEKSISTMSGQHVQIIHTNAGALGYLSPSGHSDFYPNGGIEQPGCCPSWVPGWCTFCSHARSVELFAESISKPFEGVRCQNWHKYTTGSCGTQANTTLMGGPSVNLPSSGTYYFVTRSNSPYSKTQ